VGSDARSLRDEKVKLFRQVETFRPELLVRGQYRDYVDEAGVQPGSDTETFTAVRFEIDSWRWAGVPWLIRTGECLPRTQAEAAVEFTASPRLLFAPDGAEAPHPKRVRFRLSTDTGVTFGLQVRRTGEELVAQNAALDMSFTHDERHRSAYQRLLEDALVGD